MHMQHSQIKELNGFCVCVFFFTTNKCDLQAVRVQMKTFTVY